MLGAQLPSMNKQLAGYPVEPVCYRGEGWGLENFAAARGALKPGAMAGDGCGGSIRGECAAAPGARIGLRRSIRAHHTNQTLSAWALGQVARLKLHGLAKALEMLGFVGLRRRIARYQTIQPKRAATARPALGSDRARGGWSPLSIRVPSPYPGRAGQAQDLEKPAQGPACATGCTEDALPRGAKTLKRRVGSGVGAVKGRQKPLARGHAGRGKRGPGIGGGCAAHFQLNRGKSAKLGGGRS